MSTSKYGVVEVFAFIAVLLAALVAILQMIIPQIAGTMRLVKDIIILIGVLLAGWGFTSRIAPVKVWRIIYLIAAVLCVLGFLFGNNIL